MEKHRFFLDLTLALPLHFFFLGGEFSGLCLALSVETPLGRKREALFRQHLWRTVSLLLWVPWQHTTISHHSSNRQVWRSLWSDCDCMLANSQMTPIYLIYCCCTKQLQIYYQNPIIFIERDKIGLKQATAKQTYNFTKISTVTGRFYQL